MGSTLHNLTGNNKRIYAVVGTRTLPCPECPAGCLSSVGTWHTSSSSVYPCPEIPAHGIAAPPYTTFRFQRILRHRLAPEPNIPGLLQNLAAGCWHCFGPPRPDAAPRSSESRRHKGPKPGIGYQRCWGLRGSIGGQIMCRKMNASKQLQALQHSRGHGEYEVPEEGSPS